MCVYICIVYKFNVDEDDAVENDDQNYVDVDVAVADCDVLYIIDYYIAGFDEGNHSYD